MSNLHCWKDVDVLLMEKVVVVALALQPAWMRLLKLLYLECCLCHLRRLLLRLLLMLELEDLPGLQSWLKTKQMYLHRYVDQYCFEYGLIGEDSSVAPALQLLLLYL